VSKLRCYEGRAWPALHDLSYRNLGHQVCYFPGSLDGCPEKIAICHGCNYGSSIGWSNVKVIPVSQFYQGKREFHFCISCDNMVVSGVILMIPIYSDYAPTRTELMDLFEAHKILRELAK